MYDDLRQSGHWLSPRGRLAFYRVDAYNQELNAELFMHHIVEFLRLFPTVFRLNITMGFVLITSDGKLDVFRSGQHNTHITAEPYLFLHQSNPQGSLNNIRNALVQAERQNFRNKKQQENARQSDTSDALPLYILITGTLPRSFRSWYR